MTERTVRRAARGAAAGPGGRAAVRCLAMLLFVLGLVIGMQDAKATPRTVALGDQVTGRLAADHDAFPFYALAGTKLKLTFQSGGSLKANLAIHGPDGDPVDPSALRVIRVGNKVVVSGILQDSGNHTIVVEALDGTSGPYSLKTAGKAPSRVTVTGEVVVPAQQSCAFAGLAAAQVRSITIRRQATTLDLRQPGELVDAQGAPVAIGAQRATGATLVATNATLPANGNYAFRFSPAGTGAWSAQIVFKNPKTKRTTIELPGGVASLPRTGAGPQIGFSAPANGTHFVAGEAPWVVIVLNDAAGDPLTIADLSTCGLYMYGPQDPAKTTAALKLLRAVGDRNASTHHYINLRNSPDVRTYGNVVLYPLSAVTDELPGTYTATARAVLASDGLQQWMTVADCQIGTAAAETAVVDRTKCASCHRGAMNGQYYLHHVDPGNSPTGSPAIDSWPTRTCKSCHNQDGYAAYNNQNGSPDRNLSRTPDPIIRRVHGVHMGKNLAAPFNTDPTTGDFRDYVHVVFPADVKNCTVCHVDDRWKTKPSRMACGACHDNTWFGDPAQTPAGWENHGGNTQPDDSVCTSCHTPDAPGLQPISVVHDVPPPAFQYSAELTMTPPANAGFYVAGETPQVTITVRTAPGGALVDPNTITEAAFGRGYLFVSGPREHTEPVLTTAALGTATVRAETTNGTAGPWDLSGSPTFDVEVDNSGLRTLAAVPALFADPSAATAAEVVAWLNSAPPVGIGDVATASVSGGTKVKIKSNTRGAVSEVDIRASGVQTAMSFTVKENLPAPRYYANNDVRVRPDPLDEDPKVTRSATAITYQLDDVAGLEPGTYTAFFELKPPVGLGAVTLANFQVGTATAEAMIATNCTDCHGATRMHAGYFAVPFDTDYCKNCHDYRREGTGYAWAGAPPSGTNGTSTSGWSGFGAMALARRVHGVHRGAYLDHPEEVKPGDYTLRPEYDFSEVVFPQDIRNCTKCHSESDTWQTNPSRLACLACHDSEAANAHGTLMTIDPTPIDPWSGDEIESCRVCHGKGSEFEVSKVHNVSDPYVPPYPREKE